MKPLFSSIEEHFTYQQLESAILWQDTDSGYTADTYPVSQA